jgi:hypothetical protein
LILFKHYSNELDYRAWACGVVDRAQVGDPHNTPFHASVSKLGGETSSQIMAWSLIHNVKTIVLFEKTSMRLRRI